MKREGEGERESDEEIEKRQGKGVMKVTVK